MEHTGLKHLMPRGPVLAEKEDVISTKGEDAEVGHGLFLDEGQRSLGQFTTFMDEAWVLEFCGREGLRRVVDHFMPEGWLDSRVEVETWHLETLSGWFILINIQETFSSCLVHRQ